MRSSTALEQRIKKNGQYTHLWKVQGRYREGTGKVQGRYREEWPVHTPVHEGLGEEHDEQHDLVERDGQPHDLEAKGDDLGGEAADPPQALGMRPELRARPEEGL
jgi:hypothetical protein